MPVATKAVDLSAVDWSDFDAKSFPEPNSGCWLWVGCVDARGKYGTRHVPGYGIHRAHRLAYARVNGPIPPGVFVCHRCDNPRCVNPDHLFAGSHDDNMRDCRMKGRKAKKLDWPTVREIRAAYANGGVSFVKLAEMYGIGSATAYQVVCRVIWPE